MSVPEHGSVNYVEQPDVVDYPSRSSVVYDLGTAIRDRPTGEVDPMSAQLTIKQLLEKLEQVPPERVAEVEDFIDFLGNRDGDRVLVRASQAVSESTLNTIWDNAADADYDRL